MHTDFRWIGLISAVIAVITAGIPLLMQPLDWGSSVSNSWAGSRRKFVTIAIVMSLTGAGMTLGWILWIIPFYQLPKLMYVIVSIAFIGLTAVAWVPMKERPGEHSLLQKHFLGGAAMVTLAIVAMACVTWYGSNITTATRAVSFDAMIFSACWPLLFFTRAKRIFLPLESLIALSFFMTLILLFVD
jgi:hypothetical protein